MRPTPDQSKRILRQKIARDTEAFLAAGGKITVVPPGKSGVRQARTLEEHRDRMRSKRI